MGWCLKKQNTIEVEWTECSKDQWGVSSNVACREKFGSRAYTPSDVSGSDNAPKDCGKGEWVDANKQPVIGPPGADSTWSTRETGQWYTASYACNVYPKGCTADSKFPDCISK